MTYAVILAAAVSIFAVWIYYRARHNHHCEEVTERLREALKAGAEQTVRALLISDRKWLSAQQARDAEHYIYTRDEKRDEQKVPAITWVAFADQKPDAPTGAKFLVCIAGGEVSAETWYAGTQSLSKEKWTHWAAMPKCAR